MNQMEMCGFRSKKKKHGGMLAKRVGMPHKNIIYFNDNMQFPIDHVIR